jgi:hypothetical protein
MDMGNCARQQVELIRTETVIRSLRNDTTIPVPFRNGLSLADYTQVAGQIHEPRAADASSSAALPNPAAM